MRKKKKIKGVKQNEGPIKMSVHHLSVHPKVNRSGFVVAGGILVY